MPPIVRPERAASWIACRDNLPRYPAATWIGLPRYPGRLPAASWIARGDYPTQFPAIVRLGSAITPIGFTG